MVGGGLPGPIFLPLWHRKYLVEKLMNAKSSSCFAVMVQ